MSATLTTNDAGLAGAQPPRVLFTTLQHVESEFYGDVGERLHELGHEVAHVTYSRHAAERLRARGFRVWSLQEELPAVGAFDAQAEVRRALALYDVPTFRDVYRTDLACDGRDEEWCIDRTIRHLLALERIFDEWQPDAIVPEVGNETMRTAAQLVGVARNVPVLFLFYTIFPDPLRLYVDTMDAPIVAPEDIRPLEPEDAQRVERFVRDFTERDAPIRAYRPAPLRLRRLRTLVGHLRIKATHDRENPYLMPMHWAVGSLREAVRRRAAHALYEAAPQTRPYVYFPMHLMDDYKLKRVVPHCSDQLSIIEQLARALPHGYDLVTKEHPMSLGRNRLRQLRRLRRMRNVRLVAPRTSSHALVRDSRGVAVISSTVGLEALLHDKPVLTLGRPFYAGYGLTLDLDGTYGLREAVPALLDFQPDRDAIHRFLAAAMARCHPGAPVLVDRSPENATRLAGSLSRASTQLVAARGHARRHEALDRPNVTKS